MAAYVDYEFYKLLYGDDAVPESDFNRFAWEAEKTVDNITSNKLEFAFPTKEKDVESIRRCVCAIIEKLNEVEQYKKSVMEGVGFTRREDGTITGKMVTSISSGSESIGFSSGGSSVSTDISEAAKSEEILNGFLYEIAKKLLYGVRDANGVPLLYAGMPYPGGRSRWV